MQRYLPVSDTLVSLVYHHLPSPAVAQRYRAAWLYTGAVDDAVGKSIAACDSAGPLVMFVSKMVRAARRNLGRFVCSLCLCGFVDARVHVWVCCCEQVPMPKSKQFYAYGRVFSGTVRPGMRVSVRDSAESGMCWGTWAAGALPRVCVRVCVCECAC
jgi:elongation factor 2